MPYEKHPIYVTPPDDTIIWRYMDFACFVQLLDFRELRFARADTFEEATSGSLQKSRWIDRFHSNPRRALIQNVRLTQSLRATEETNRLCT